MLVRYRLGSADPDEQIALPPYVSAGAELERLSNELAWLECAADQALGQFDERSEAEGHGKLKGDGEYQLIVSLFRAIRHEAEAGYAPSAEYDCIDMVQEILQAAELDITLPERTLRKYREDAFSG